MKQAGCKTRRPSQTHDTIYANEAVSTTVIRSKLMNSFMYSNEQVSFFYHARGPVKNMCCAMGNQQPNSAVNIKKHKTCLILSLMAVTCSDAIFILVPRFTWA